MYWCHYSSRTNERLLFFSDQKQIYLPYLFTNIYVIFSFIEAIDMLIYLFIIYRRVDLTLGVNGFF